MVKIDSKIIILQPRFKLVKQTVGVVAVAVVVAAVVATLEWFSYRNVVIINVVFKDVFNRKGRRFNLFMNNDSS